MKNLITTLFISLMIFAFINCGKKTADLPGKKVNAKLEEAVTKALSACGSANPDKSLQWLKDIIVKGEAGVFTGRIYSTFYQNKPVFYIRMLTESGGVTTYIYDCTGTTVSINPGYDLLAISLEALKGGLIYSNVSGGQLNLKPEELVTKANSACGSVNPNESLKWLKDIIVKAEDDIATRNNLSNHIGRVYLYVNQNKPLFYIQMALGSGGLPGHIFDCNGTKLKTSPNVDVDVPSFPAEPQKYFQLIYSNVPPG